MKDRTHKFDHGRNGLTTRKNDNKSETKATLQNNDAVVVVVVVGSIPYDLAEILIVFVVAISPRVQGSSVTSANAQVRIIVRPNRTNVVVLTTEVGKQVILCVK